MKKSIVAFGVAALSALSSVAFASPMYKVCMEVSSDGAKETVPAVIMQEKDLYIGRWNCGGAETCVAMMPVMVDGKECISVHISKPNGETLVEEELLPADGKANICVGSAYSIAVSSRTFAE